MVYLSFSDNPDTCHYAAPLPIVPTLRADTFKLEKIDYTPIFGTGEKTLLDYGGRFPWEAYVPDEYEASIREAAGLKQRTDVKPYRVLQPEGASVSVCKGLWLTLVHPARASRQLAKVVIPHRLQLPRGRRPK